MAPKLFQPTKVGLVSLNHRVVLAPLTRFRASNVHIPHTRIVKEYYEQRAHTPGTLLITEATYIAERAGGYNNAPGIWNQHQIDAWKEITDAIHAKAVGSRPVSRSEITGVQGSTNVSASDVQLSSETVAPRPLTIEEIKEYVELYAQAARNAVSAGFDRVEIHGANGYLLDQFTRDVTNKRTDMYGGSIENRVRFPLEVVDAVAEAIGPERVGYRISPWNHPKDTTMVDPKPTFGYLASQLKARQPRLAYLHVVEPRMLWMDDRKDEEIGVDEENDFIRSVWSPKPLISAGGYHCQSAIDTAEDKGDLIAFGRHFIANPDLVYRLEKDIKLNPYDRKTFYLPGEITPTGYTDYPFAEDYTVRPLL
ncbi:FMN-linked oxidoreductase [Desarmillaria tabescens]|uniref:FMN-linked oxidoreductase n=1 Tax=Armillaria tabescens TaxID=1929756 RepID=A0AA39KAQ1_ARMTA|nr:FMN-linked oxidoreductase [Desarmillaria tabescens]KAK0455323.1 FMN-linked oxidoreductase [Desarmillaria tabescens]